MAPKPSIVLVHGLWRTPHSGGERISHSKRLATKFLPQAALNSLTITDVVNNYERVIKGLNTPPIIMGHSFGGLFTQLLLTRGLRCARIAISATGPAGVKALTLPTFKSIFPVRTNNNGVIPLFASQFHYIFTNELDDAESEKVYKEFHIPSSAHVLWQGALASLHNSGNGEVIWDKADRAPLLLIGGGNDYIVPVAVPQAVVKKYSGPAIVEYKEFPGRKHHICWADWLGRSC